MAKKHSSGKKTKAKNKETKHSGNQEPERYVDIYESSAEYRENINGKEVLFSKT
jgi:hypothetical protein